MDSIRHPHSDNIINGTRFYTEDENDLYIRPYLTEEDGTHLKVNGKKFDRYNFLASFEKIIAHVIQTYADDITYEAWLGYKLIAEKMSKWYNYDPRDGTGLGQREQGSPSPVDNPKGNYKKTKNKKPDNIRRLLPFDVRITAEGTQYFIFAKDKVYYASLDGLGEIVQGDLYLGHAADLELDINLPPREVGQRIQRHSRHPMSSPQHVLASRLQDTARPTHGTPPPTHVQRAKKKIPFGP
jgi:hypothetical protein